MGGKFIQAVWKRTKFSLMPWARIREAYEDKGARAATALPSPSCCAREIGAGFPGLAVHG